MEDRPFEPQISDDVRETLSHGGPVVALESTLIAHGLPYPDNLAAAREMEAVIRAAGATPATIAVLDGLPRVGLDAETLQLLATSDQVHKLSRRDLAIAFARRWHGATTVASTIIIAARAGIRVFATGGIGGVHRGHAGDVSADLPELARTRMIVVCAGAKAILDLPATLEWLETHGVPVLGYGTAHFPAFYATDSGMVVDQEVHKPAEVADIAAAMWNWGVGAGLLVTVPPPEESALSSQTMEEAIGRALADAERQRIRGRAITPFLLNRVSELTDGASLATNLALLRQNARVAAQIAIALSDLTPSQVWE